MTLMPPAWSSTDLEAARQAMGTGRTEEARSHLAKTLQHPPSDLPNRQLLATLLVEARFFQDALRVLDITLANHPADPLSVRLRAKCRAARGDLAGALLDAENAVRLSGESDESLRTLHRCHVLRNDRPTALRIARTLTERLPDDGEAWLARGEDARETGDMWEAEEAWTRAAAAAPAPWQAPYNLAILRTERGENEAAITLLAQAIRVAPHERPPRSVLGHLLWQEIGYYPRHQFFRELLLANVPLSAEQQQRLQRFPPEVIESFQQQRLQSRRDVRVAAGLISAELGILGAAVGWTYVWLTAGAAAAKLHTGWGILYVLLLLLAVVAAIGLWSIVSSPFLKPRSRPPSPNV